MKTPSECKRILSRIGLKVGVSPNKISSSLLSPQDKREMMSGELTEQCLELHVKLWAQNGMPECVNK